MSKKLLLCLLLVCVFVGCLFASPKLSKSDTNKILSMEMAAKSFSDTEKMMFYNQSEKGSGGPFALNLLVGCGIGSFVQGDTTGGIVGLAGELGSILLFYSGYSTYYANLLSSTLAGSTTISDEGLGTMVMGAVGLLGFRIYECIRPFTYANSYNQQLTAAIYSSPVKTAILPVVSDDNTVHLGLVTTISL